jgi:3-oxoacyl-[acyl-carrier protein] reductase
MAQRVILVTGAARGVGAAVCRHFATLGYDIVVNYNNSALQAEKLVEEISAHARTALHQADISNPDSVKALMDFCLQKFGRLDVLVNNASYSSNKSWNVTLENIDWSEWQKTIDVDLKGTMLCSHAAYPIMKAQGTGKIINFSSSAALQGDVPTYFYTAAKCAIVGITRGLARAMAPEVRVNCIAPGSIATDWIEKWKLTPQDINVIVGETPLRRIGRPDEVAKLVELLASDDCAFMTGQTFVIDGGILML